MVTNGWVASKHEGRCRISRGVRFTETYDTLAADMNCVCVYG